MASTYQFEKQEDSYEVLQMEKEWVNRLLSPQDGMWESFRKSSEYWVIKIKEVIIGYYNFHEEFGLIQFYLKSECENLGNKIFSQLIRQKAFDKAIVGTNNSQFYKTANSFFKEIKTHTYLFELEKEVALKEKQGKFRLSELTDLERIVKFTNISINSPEEWTRIYTSDLIEKKEHYILELDQEIVGISEVRKSISQNGIADIGVIVNPKFRRKGYGTYLLNKGKSIAIEYKLIPICSCEVNNIGSMKSIQKCGFKSNHQLLKMTF